MILENMLPSRIGKFLKSTYVCEEAHEGVNCDEANE